MRVSGIATGSDENGLSCVATGSVLNERVSDIAAGSDVRIL